MNRDRQDTLPGVPLPGVEPTAKEELQTLVREAVAEAFRPYADIWTRRAQDMLEVLAEASHSRVDVRSSVRTMRRAAWTGVLVLFVTGIALWAAANAERQDRARLANYGEVKRGVAVSEINAHTSRVCGARP